MTGGVDLLAGVLRRLEGRAGDPDGRDTIVRHVHGWRSRGGAPAEAWALVDGAWRGWPDEFDAVAGELRAAGYARHGLALLDLVTEWENAA